MRNLLASFYFFAARAVCSVIQLRILSEHFGSQFSGLNALLNQVYLYVTLFELGLAASAVSLLYQPLHAKDEKRASELLTALHRDSMRLTFYAAPAVFGALAVYTHFMHTSLPFGTVFGSLALTATSGLLALLSLAYQSYLNAAENIFQVHCVLGTSFVIKTIIGLALALRTGNYIFLPLSNACLSVVELLALRFLFRRHFPTYQRSVNRDVAREVRSRARFALCHKVSGLVYYQSDFVILSLTATLSSVNTYAKYQYLSLGVLGLIGAAFTSMTATIARKHIAADGHGQERQYASITTACYFAGLLFLLGYLFTANSFVALLYGSAPLDWPLLSLFAVQLWLNVIKTVDDTFIAAKGAFNVALYLPISEPVVYIGLALPLVHFFGFRGILAASIFVNIVFAVVAKSFVTARAVLALRIGSLARLKLHSFSLAVLLAAPLVATYMLFARYPSSFSYRFSLPNAVGLLYAVPICYWLLRRTPPTPLAIPDLLEKRAA